VVSSLVRVRFGAFAAVGILALAAACSSDGSTGPSNGTLTVTISTPAGVTGSVTVTGPNGYSKTLTATQSLMVPSGSYTVAGANAVTPYSIVGSDTNVATVTGSPASVGRNQTATVTVSYGADTSTGGLWIANAANTSTTNEFVEFGASQLTASGSPTPVAGFLGQHNTGVVAVAFDRQGNLWSVTQERQITEYTAAQLDSANPTAVRTFTIPGNATNPSGLAFDSAGNLWAVDPGPCEFYEYAAATLANRTGAVTLAPDLTIDPQCNGFIRNPTGIAFDRNWNLWVSDNIDNDVYEYSADSLKQGFTGHHAMRVITGLDYSQYLAFDASGNLWLTAGYTDSLYAYSVAQLADTTRAPPPHIAIGLSATQANPQALAFDNSGNLWIADAGSATNAVYELSASQLTASGSVTPAVTLTGSALAQPYGLAFAPHSSGLPLFLHAPPVPTSTRTRGRVR
jgi:hypothetical protein